MPQSRKRPTAYGSRYKGDDAIIRIYGQHKGNPLIKWKDSIKAVVGLARPNVAGLDE